MTLSRPGNEARGRRGGRSGQAEDVRCVEVAKRLQEYIIIRRLGEGVP
eukprot:CAMPEP_0180794474 /NCGR_PEP_ID=MMETSP1038_2-20121128/55634_1 /TAXON_ID=632150 /ORGANISM="Azadinium spinosum, Strain 3D9" /LENGTH=47 /DNA_ID= /DNA_START= /DNA_END= /DNA_ORIENTATION=